MRPAFQEVGPGFALRRRVAQQVGGMEHRHGRTPFDRLPVAAQFRNPDAGGHAQLVIVELRLIRGLRQHRVGRRQRLRWNYGRKRESLPADMRALHPARSFMSNNFLVHKKVFFYHKRLVQKSGIV